VSMTGKIEHVEVITSVQRRRRWSAEEKAAIVQETCAPGMSVSLVARRRGIAPNLRVPVERDHGFRWKMITQSGGT
jgi:transposase